MTAAGRRITSIPWSQPWSDTMIDSDCLPAPCNIYALPWTYVYGKEVKFNVDLNGDDKI